MELTSPNSTDAQVGSFDLFSRQNCDLEFENKIGNGNRKCTGNPATSGSGRDSDLDSLINRGPVSVCINADGLKNYR